MPAPFVPRHRRRDRFVFEGDQFRAPLSGGAALLQHSDRSTNDLFARASERLAFAKDGGRDRICG